MTKVLADRAKIIKFISGQKTAFIASVDGEGYPVVRAMLAPRKIDGKDIYFSTNTSSRKVAHFTSNPKACVYFYRRGTFKYQGVSITGEVIVCTDGATKKEIWRTGDSLIYKKGVTDPDYCVLKFTCKSAQYYCDLKTAEVDFGQPD